jgi:hypothetical protein
VRKGPAEIAKNVDEISEIHLHHGPQGNVLVNQPFAVLRCAVLLI